MLIKVIPIGFSGGNYPKYTTCISKSRKPRIDENFDAFETLEMVEDAHDCYADHPKKLIELFEEEKKSLCDTRVSLQLEIVKEYGLKLLTKVLKF